MTAFAAEMGPISQPATGASGIRGSVFDVSMRCVLLGLSSEACSALSMPKRAQAPIHLAREHNHVA